MTIQNKIFTKVCLLMTMTYYTLLNVKSLKKESHHFIGFCLLHNMCTERDKTLATMFNANLPRTCFSIWIYHEKNKESNNRIYDDKRSKFTQVRFVQFNFQIVENKSRENPKWSETFTFRCLIKCSLFNVHSECQWTLHWCISLYVNGKICSLEMFIFKINACIVYAVHLITDAIYGIETIRIILK